MTDTLGKIKEFVNYARSLKGYEKGEAQVFCDRLFQAFGHRGCVEAGAKLEYRLNWTISLPARAIASATFLKREFDHSEPKAFYGLKNMAAKAKRHRLTSQEYLEQRSSWKFDERDHKFYPPT
jgi:hypothetical protein